MDPGAAPGSWHWTMKPTWPRHGHGMAKTWDIRGTLEQALPRAMPAERPAVMFYALTSALPSSLPASVAVRFRVTAPRRLHVYVCNCSICAMKRNDHFIVPRAAFELLAGEDALTTYTFGTGRAQHKFAASAACRRSTFRGPTRTAWPSPRRASRRRRWTRSSGSCTTAATGRRRTRPRTLPGEASPLHDTLFKDSSLLYTGWKKRSALTRERCYR